MKGAKVGLLSVLLILVAALAGFRNLGRWLTSEDPLSPGDAIVVLSGGLPYRVEAAAKIFRAGYAPEVWVTRPESPEKKLADLGVNFVGEQEYDREILLHQGVPDAAVHILPDPIVDTEQELEEVTREMLQTGKRKVIIVTSPQHTRRVKLLWNKRSGHNLKAMVHAARNDPFDTDHWWRNTRDCLAVVREMMGLMNVWAGSPVRPHTN